MKGHALSDPRLLALANKIPAGAVVADIGTDHGYLVCHLAEQGRIAYAYACDIGELPLQNARRQVEQRGLANLVETRLTDGLQGLPIDRITHVVIAGMGGEVIAGILAACPDAQRPNLRFLLQPMTKAERLRGWLCQHGYEIETEDGIAAGKFFYSVMEVAYTGVKREPEPLFCWTGRLPQSTESDSSSLLYRIAFRLRRTGEGLLRSQSQSEEGQAYLDLAHKIQRITGECP